VGKKMVGIFVGITRSARVDRFAIASIKGGNLGLPAAEK
jgi:hypothetical protein